MTTLMRKMMVCCFGMHAQHISHVATCSAKICAHALLLVLIVSQLARHESKAMLVHTDVMADLQPKKCVIKVNLSLGGLLQVWFAGFRWLPDRFHPEYGSSLSAKQSFSRKWA